MRYTRLKRAIEGGTLIGTHGIPFQGTPEKPPRTQKKRKRPTKDEILLDGDDVGPIQTRSGKYIIRKARESTGSSEGAASESSDEYDVPSPVKHSTRVHDQIPGRPIPTFAAAKQELEMKAMHGTLAKSEGRHDPPRAPGNLISLGKTAKPVIECGEDSYLTGSSSKPPSRGQSAIGFDSGKVLETKSVEGERFEADVDRSGQGNYVM